MHDEIILQDGTLRRWSLNRLDVFVLRFDPQEYAESHIGETVGEIGPYAWKDVESQDEIDRSFLTNSELVR